LLATSDKPARESVTGAALLAGSKTVVSGPDLGDRLDARELVRKWLDSSRPQRLELAPARGD
jgi:hypothetical protein